MTYWSSSVVYCALLPIFVVSHELGHAAVNLARSEAPVSVKLGRTPGRWHFRLGRLDVTIGLNFWSFRKPAGTVSRVPLDKWSTVACGLAGPLAQAAASALLIPVGVATHHAAIGDAGVLGVGFALTSLLPFRLHGYRSDGAKLLQVFHRKQPDPALAEKLSRWLALVKDLHGTLGAERGRVLNAVPILVEHPGTGPDSIAVFRIAVAGWCWRSIESDASFVMREAALDAIQEATSSGAAEPDLSIIAARALAGRESSSGYEQVTVYMRSSAVDDAKQRWAFQFGVAFYDIERARGSVG